MPSARRKVTRNGVGRHHPDCRGVGASCVFARFLEDNRLVDPPKIAGPSERLERARDEHELYFRAHPTETDREYLLQSSTSWRSCRSQRDLRPHNPIHELPNWLSGDAAGELLKFFQKIDANTGALVHDFTDPNWDTRFLGDLYQDLSEAARKKYALLQTPEFVEEFILDRTLDPAIEEFGLDGFRMIDPACGSGHFLLGQLRRLLERWQKKEPGTNARGVGAASTRQRPRRRCEPLRGRHRPVPAAAGRADVNAAFTGCRTRRGSISTSLWAIRCCTAYADASSSDGLSTSSTHHYQSEDCRSLQRLLVPGTYHAVSRIRRTSRPRTGAERGYRERYSTCHMKYSLAVPFMERIFQLAVDGGFTGQITAN